MMFEIRVLKRLFAAVVVSFLILAAFSVWFMVESAKPHSCSIFTVVQGDTVLYGDNFDYHVGNLAVGFFPATWSKYGSIIFGYLNEQGGLQGQRAVNDQGLNWAVNSVPAVKINSHPEREYSHLEDNYLTMISRHAATVEEALSFLEQFDFGGSMVVQIHIADANGDAAVIGPGPDGEMAYTRKVDGDGYLFSTNFNLLTPDKGPKDFRWETGNSMLEELKVSQVLTPGYAMGILQAISLDHPTTLTLISRVVDPVNGTIRMVYMSQFQDVVEIDINEELAKGQRVVDMRDFFSKETAEAGDQAWQKFLIRFRILQVTVVLVGVGILSLIVLLVVRAIRKRRKAVS